MFFLVRMSVSMSKCNFFIGIKQILNLNEQHTIILEALVEHYWRSKYKQRKDGYMRFRDFNVISIFCTRKAHMKDCFVSLFIRYIN